MAPDDNGLLKLQIDPLIAQAESLADRIQRELPTHAGLLNVARSSADAARRARSVVRSMRRPLSLHRLPVVFLAIALAVFAGWAYFSFVHVSSLTLAIPDRDAVELRKMASAGRVSVVPVPVPGSREAAALVAEGKVDLAFIQGGMPFPSALARQETPGRELVLFFLREGLSGPAQVRRILTSLQGEGSHTVAQTFAKAWGIGGKVEFIHEWSAFAKGALRLPPGLDAVFVVKDPADETVLQASARLEEAGFRLASPDLGARGAQLDYLTPTSIARGYLRPDPALPADQVQSYGVSTFLVARKGLTPRLLSLAAQIVAPRNESLPTGPFLSASEASEVFQGADALLSILVNIGLAFLALLGLDVVAWRKPFHELNSLVSLTSLLQSSKDVLGVEETALRNENLLYLSLCSDLLGLISGLSSYYTQENSSLLFNNLSEVVHQRCDSLKLNIQLKILHATVEVTAPAVAEPVPAKSTTEAAPEPSAATEPAPEAPPTQKAV